MPPELEITAKELLRSVEVHHEGTDGVATGNALRDITKLEVESRMSNTDKFSDASATAWFVFASPQDVPLIVGFLDGRETPVVESFGLDHSVEQLGYSFRVYHDYGACLGDPKAGHRSDGA